MTLDFEFLHKAINDCQDLIRPHPELLSTIGCMVDYYIDHNRSTNLYVSGHFAAAHLSSVMDNWPDNKDTYLRSCPLWLSTLDMALYMSFKEYREISERENSYCHRTFAKSNNNEQGI